MLSLCIITLHYTTLTVRRQLFYTYFYTPRQKPSGANEKKISETNGVHCTESPCSEKSESATYWVPWCAFWYARQAYTQDYRSLSMEGNDRPPHSAQNAYLMISRRLTRFTVLDCTVIICRLLQLKVFLLSTNRECAIFLKVDA